MKLTLRELVLLVVTLGPIMQPCPTDETEAEKLVASFANENPLPKLFGERRERKAVFPRNYDWEEQARVVKAVQNVLKVADEAWPALIDHLEDEEFCLVYYSDAFGREEYPSIQTVGDVCQEIVLANLTNGYNQHLPGFKEAIIPLRRPDYVPKERAPLKQWCDEQQDKGRSLLALQLEAAEWAVKRVPELPGPLPKDEIQESVSAIESEIARLRKSEKPVLAKRIWGEGRHPVTKAEATIERR